MNKAESKNQNHSRGYYVSVFALTILLLCQTLVNAAVWTSAASGAWTTPSSWSLVSGTPAASYPTSNDLVTITTHTINTTTTASCSGLTINAAGALSIGAGLSVVISGNLTNSGKLIASTAVLYVQATAAVPNATITQTGTMSGTYVLYLRPYGRAVTIASGSTLNVQQAICNGSGGTVTNLGSLTTTSVFKTDNNVAYINGVNSSLTVSSNLTLLASGFDASANPNTVTYTGSGWNSFYGTTYHNLTLAGSGAVATKQLFSDLTVNGTFFIGYNVQVDCNNKNITINGTWMNANTASPLLNPPAQFTFGGTNPTIRRNTNPESFTNVVVACTGTLTCNASSVSPYTGNFSCNNLTLQSGTLDLNATSNYTVSVRGNMTSTGGTLNGQNGYISFVGTAAQTIGGNTLTFSNINVNNAAGVSTTAAENLTGTLNVASGSFTSNTADFTLVSNTSTGVTARIAPLTTGSVSGNRWVVQRRIITSAPSSSTPYWDDFSSPVTSANLSDWDNEMYLSAVGGNDGTACCPIFYSVKQWNNGGGNYSDVASLIPLVPGYGYSIWTASNMSSLSPFTFDTRGTPNQGTITKSSLGNDYYLLGNPYPSQILFSSLTRTNVGNYFWVLDETLQDYAYWDGATGTGKLNGSGGVINSSQGFMVQSFGGGSVGFTETAKSASNVAFVRQACPMNMVKFHFNKGEKQVGMESMIHFIEGGNNNTDELDIPYIKAPFLTKRYEAKSLSRNGVALSKNTLNLNEEKQEVPVIFKPADPGDFTLNLEGVTNLNAFTCVTLEDQDNGTFVDLSNEHTYLFTCNDNSERHFVLHFTKGKENISCIQRSKVFASIASDNAIANNVYDSENAISIEFTNEDVRTTNISVFNTVGELVSAEQFVGGNVSSVKRPSQAGVYFVVLSRDGKTETHKVIIK